MVQHSETRSRVASTTALLTRFVSGLGGCGFQKPQCQEDPLAELRRLCTSSSMVFLGAPEVTKVIHVLEFGLGGGQ